jgi:hypothetical protein
MLREPRHGEDTSRCPERDDELLVADLQRSRERRDGDRLPFSVVSAHTAEHELGMRTHLADGDDDVPRLDRARRAFGKQWGVQHRVLESHDRRAAGA